MRVGLLVTCTVDQFSGKRVELLSNYLLTKGYQLYYPNDFTCCGRLLFEAGDEKGSKILKEKIIEEYKECECVISTCTLCAKYLKNKQILQNKIVTIEEFLKNIGNEITYENLPFQLYKIEDLGSLEVISLVNPKVCNALIEREINKALALKMQYLLTSEESYLLHFENYIKTHKINLKIFHIIDLLIYGKF